ncbi:MAG: c-type cytochrome domain-containing protein [Bryobacteraceae bacterium]
MRPTVVYLVVLASAALAQQPSFNSDVAPILAANCLGCHGKSSAMGGLSLQTFEALMKGGKSRAVIVPGRPEESKLFAMISGKAMPAMPLGGKPLGEADRDTIRRWIEAGAKGPGAGEMAAKLAPAVPEVKPLVSVKPQITSLAWSPDGKWLAQGSYKEVRLVEPDSGKIVATLSGAAQEVRSLAFSADGKLLAAAGGLPARGGEVQIWDVAGRTLVRTIQGHTDCIYSVSFLSDGKRVVTASYDKLLKLWNVESGKEILTFKDHIDSVFALAVTPDDKRLVSAAADRAVKVWDIASGERLYSMSDAQDGLNAVALDPAGRRVAAGGLDKSIRIWTLGEKSATLTNSLIAHEDAILQVTWSPDGQYLVSSSADRTLKVFKAEDLTEVKSLSQPDWVLALKFSPDGRRLAAGRFDGSVTLFKTSELFTGSASDKPLVGRLQSNSDKR